MITLNMHEYKYEYSENKYTPSTTMITLEYSSTITLEYNHDYFHKYPVSNIKATFM